MKIDKKFKFTVNISREGYINKKEAIACLSSKGAKSVGKEKMAFRELTVNVSEFLDYATKGYSFCGIFEFDNDKRYFLHTNKQYVNYKAFPVYKRGANKGCMKLGVKSDEFFKSSQVVFIDIDYTRFTKVSDYIDTLTLKPTCVYMSYSDNIKKIDVNQKDNPLYTEEGILSRRFRLVYIFEKQLEKDQLSLVSSIINEQIEKDTNEKIQDKCGIKISQYFNGCYGKKEIYEYNVIYSYDDIVEKENNTSTTIFRGIQSIDQSKVTNQKVSSQIYYDMKKLPYDDFMHYYRSHTPYIYRVEKDTWINNEYQFTDEGYFSLYYNVNILKDGQKRRKKLFERMCLRRVINPDATPDILFFDAYEDVHRFFDNSDNVLDVDCLKNNVESAFKYTIEEIEEKYSNHLKYLRSKRPKIILKKGIAFSVVERNKKFKDIRYSLIDEVYNPKLTVKENLNYICSNVFSVCEKTLYNYCNDRKINLKQSKLSKEDKILTLYDPNLSIRKNIELLRKHGIKVSFGKLAKLIKK